MKLVLFKPTRCVLEFKLFCILMRTMLWKHILLFVQFIASTPGFQSPLEAFLYSLQSFLWKRGQNLIFWKKSSLFFYFFSACQMIVLTHVNLVQRSSCLVERIKPYLFCTSVRPKNFLLEKQYITTIWVHSDLHVLVNHINFLPYVFCRLLGSFS